MMAHPKAITTGVSSKEVISDTETSTDRQREAETSHAKTTIANRLTPSPALNLEPLSTSPRSAEPVHTPTTSSDTTLPRRESSPFAGLERDRYEEPEIRIEKASVDRESRIVEEEARKRAEDPHIRVESAQPNLPSEVVPEPEVAAPDAESALVASKLLHLASNLAPTLPSILSLGLDSTSIPPPRITPAHRHDTPSLAVTDSHPVRQPILVSPAKSPEEIKGYLELPPLLPLPPLPPLPRPSYPPKDPIMSEGIFSARRATRTNEKATPVKNAQTKEPHSALSSKEGWVVPERDVKIRSNGRPPVWAVGRQELCESLEYFKAYQGGHYDRQERCFGYLLDGFPSANDRCDQKGKVIISHGGGSAHSTAAGFVLHSDQERSNIRMRALQNCLDSKVPVILLAGNQYNFFPKLRSMGQGEGRHEVRYAVLGAYFVTHLWAEGEPVSDQTRTEPAQEEYFVRFKVRFEWVESQGTPWFEDVIGKASQCDFPIATFHSLSNSLPPLPSPRATSPVKSTCSSGSPIPSAPATSVANDGEENNPNEVTCASCGARHRAIYEEGITCYNETCHAFFRLPDGRMPHPAHLTYNPSMLSLSPDAPLDSLIPQPVSPRTLQSLAHSPSIRDYSRAAWRGYGCSDCGRLSSRSEWLKLSCSECSAEVDAAGTKLTVEEVQAMTRRETRGRRPLTTGEPLLCVSSIIRTPVKSGPGHAGYTYDLGDGSRVHHFWPATADGYAEANRLFREYQGEAAGRLFKRNPLSMHRVQGSLLCQQFTWNGGKEYLHAIAAETFPFFESDERAPEDASPVSDNTAATSTESSRFAAPCAKDACEYLKNIVPSVVSDDTVGETAFNEILSVAYMVGGRMNYHDDGEFGLGPVVASISLGADAVMSFRPKRKGPKGLGNKTDAPEPAPRGPTVVLKLRLRHGDVMVMEGAEMQKRYEHAVEPDGLRFAATARLIGPDHAKKRTSTLPKKKTLASSRSSPSIPCPISHVLNPVHRGHRFKVVLASELSC
ncbi:hypothetical protein JCM11491_003567 [Sporobolomyces phaffii]